MSKRALLLKSFNNYKPGMRPWRPQQLSPSPPG